MVFELEKTMAILVRRLELEVVGEDCVLQAPVVLGDAAAQPLDLGHLDTGTELQVVPQIDSSVKLYNHREGPY